MGDRNWKAVGRCLATGLLFLLCAGFAGCILLGFWACLDGVWFGWSGCVFRSSVGANVMYHHGVVDLELCGDSVGPFGVEQCNI